MKTDYIFELYHIIEDFSTCFEIFYKTVFHHCKIIQNMI